MGPEAHHSEHEIGGAALFGFLGLLILFSIVADIAGAK